MKSFFIVIFSLVFFSAESFSYIGSETGNGGDSTAIQIKSIGHSMLSELKYASAKHPIDVDIEKLAKSLEKVKIETTFKLLLLHGKIKNAINYPEENRILFNSIMWRQLSLREKRMLVLHELLGLNGIDDSDYKLTFDLEKLAASNVPYIKGKDEECFDEKNNPIEGQILNVNVVNIIINSDIYSATEREIHCLISVRDGSGGIHKLTASFENRCKKVFSEAATNYKFRVVNNHICEILK